ncbi:MAG: polysaccharide biosynthesis C-terminal domain-containing protein, partial [Firmicutes bacterium]|nr:polysaccharide biosynthesis C-terminal domain-containing protein [Bacillota bacterium]
NDTKTPVFAAISSIVVNIILSIILVDVMQQGGLALAYSICGIVNMILLLIFLYMKIGDYGVKPFLISMLKISAACIIMGLAVSLVSSGWEMLFGTGSKFAQLFELLFAIGIGAGVYFGTTFLWKMEECRQVWGIFSRRLKRKKSKSNA